MDLKTLLLIFCCSLPAFASTQHQHNEDYEKALQAYYNDQPEEAYIHVKNVLQAQPQFVPAKILLGNILLDNNYTADAVLTFKEALKEGGDLEIILEPLAKALLHQKRYEELTLFKLNKRISATTKAKWHVLRAKAFAKLKDYQSEKQEYQRALKLAPDSTSVLNDIATYYFINKNIKNAQNFINKVFILEPENHQALHLQGQIYKQQNKVDEASSIFLKY